MVLKSHGLHPLSVQQLVLWLAGCTDAANIANVRSIAQLQ